MGDYFFNIKKIERLRKDGFVIGMDKKIQIGFPFQRLGKASVTFPVTVPDMIVIQIIKKNLTNFEHIVGSMGNV
jgi:hypothetical protein